MYRLLPSESTQQALRRSLLSELDGALEWVGGADRPLDLRVHETRKHLKRVRALLDLGRSALEKSALTAQARAARAAARELSPLRGRAALLTCFSDLLERAPEFDQPDVVQRVRSVLSPAEVTPSETEPPLKAARSILLRARAEATQLELTTEPSGWDAYAPGFQRTYREARRALAHATHYPTARQLHAFRTSEKRHLYQVEWLEPLWEGPLRAQREELAELGEHLGDHHDLSLLWAELGRHPQLQEDRTALSSVVERRLDKLQRAALALGARAFAEKPSAITRRFGAYFRAAVPSP